VKALQSVLEKLLREMREEPAAERGATARRQGNVQLDA
jgi:hypothetical protein